MFKTCPEFCRRKARPVLPCVMSTARPQPSRRAERTEEYVSTANGRPACALARRSASTRRREAAPAKAGNAPCLPAEAPAQARRPFSTLPLIEYDGFAALDQHPMFHMQSDRSGQDQQFKITALANEVFHRTPMTDMTTSWPMRESSPFCRSG